MDQREARIQQSAYLSELDQYLEQLLDRERFRKSPSLRQLLKYLVQKAKEGYSSEIKESTIAMDVLGRSPEFDGQLDNIVRVQAHRLRKTLQAYYESEGATDRYRIVIPKGGYVPTIKAEERPPTIPDEVALAEAPAKLIEPPDIPLPTVPPLRLQPCVC